MRNPGERGTRERILDVAESSLGDCGYHGTRLHDIARRVGIQKASLFHYFPSKEQLYRSVVEEGFGQTEQTIRAVLGAAGSPLEKVRSLVSAYVEMVAAHPERTKILLRQSLGDAPAGYQTADAERLLRFVAAFVAEGQQAKVFAPIDPLALVLAVVGMVAFFFTSAPVLAPTWLSDPWSAASVERVRRHVVDIVERCLLCGPAFHAAGTQAAKPVGMADPRAMRAAR
ncbi:MAG: TetR/AcrR family transcriptional regulator [Candidatus Binatia bacterium]